MAKLPRNFWYQEESDDYRLETTHKPRRNANRRSANEAVRCQHCQRLGTPDTYGEKQRKQCSYCTERTLDTVYPPDEEPKKRKPRYTQEEETFKCRHCHRFVCPPLYGSHHRNHCPYCLFSRHVDEKRPGDRMSTCGESMEPVGYFQRHNGEYVLVHRCFGCQFERFNRIAADDDFELVLSLPELPPRTTKEVKAEQILGVVEEEADRIA